MQKKASFPPSSPSVTAFSPEQPTAPPRASATTATTQRLLARLELLPKLPLRIGLLLGSGLLLDGFDTVIVAIVLTPILASFGLSSHLALGGFLIGAGYIGQLLGALLMGSLSERFGRKTVFIIASAWFGLLSLFAAFAPSFPLLLGARLVQGIGLGGSTPVATALYAEFVPARSRGLHASFMQALYALGFVLAPVIALLLTPFIGPTLGWRLLLGLGALPLIIALLSSWLVPESVRWLCHKGRYTAAAKTVSLLEQAGGMISPPREEDEATQQALTRPVGKGTLQTQTPKSGIGELFSPRYRLRLILVWLQWFAGAAILVGLSSWLPTLYRLAGVSAFNTQFLNIAFGLGVLLTLGLYAATADRFGRKTWFLIGFGLATIAALSGCGAFVGQLPRNINVWILAPLGSLTSIGAYVCVIGNFVYTAELFPTRCRAFALATAKAWSAIASVLSPVVIGMMTATTSGTSLTFGLLGLTAYIALMVCIPLVEQTQGNTLEIIAP